MSDMPVEALLGWRPWMTCGSEVISWFRDEHPSVVAEATVDDLVAWLSDDGGTVDIYAPSRHAEPPRVGARVVVTKGPNFPICTVSETIRKALIAAVRKVADV